MRISPKDKTINVKIVYFGTGLGGKTTNLQNVFSRLNPAQKLQEELIEVRTEGDKTLFYEFAPLSVRIANGYELFVSIYTVPGQDHYEMTRKSILKDADGVVFVADSSHSTRNSNIVSYDEMYKFLSENGIDPSSIPIIIQFNKRDLESAMPLDVMQSDLLKRDEPFIEAIALQGKGVGETARRIIKAVTDNINSKFI